ncbi:GNAT family N-acetyltransferase [Modestobacter sp. Leaf380]|uniref:GNAT family N-acetyltransferase n=1 Tax=Modestobacter sp. Leaf380 TaxID=1736356 RepID=UPI0006F1E0F7|nr:GNAT family N-acetyltransferase [Modestobacter sp. Leaf380]KQS66151.1 GCN5 family acetyltransferase [Modestobacter sp. Leaf380]
MTDPSALRPATPEDWPRFSRAMSVVFAEEATGPYVDEVPPTAELDRSLALIGEDGRVHATSGVYSTELTVPGGAAVPTAGVTWVTVSPTHRRQGVLTAVMRRQLDEVHAAGREPLAALWAAESGIYGRFGYAPATRRGGWTTDPTRLRWRPDAPASAGTVSLVDEAGYRAGAVGLYERLRREVPGTLARDGRWWDRRLRDDKEQREGATPRQLVLHTESDGTVTGFAAYRVKGTWTDGGEPSGTLTVQEVRASTPAAYAALWRLLLSVDLVRTVSYPLAPADEALRHLVANPRLLEEHPADALWVRLVDVDRALAARRYPAPIDLVIEVRDPFCPWNEGRWRLSGHPAGGYCGRTDRDPDLVLGTEELAAAYLGGTSLAALQAAGRVTEVSPGAVTLASTSFSWPVAPWCADEF